jgi:hypothetical protein
MTFAAFLRHELALWLAGWLIPESFRIHTNQSVRREDGGSMFFQSIWTINRSVLPKRRANRHLMFVNLFA